MHLLVGLGNPGDQYRANRHNIGFMAIDAIARQHTFSPFRQKFSGLLAEGEVEGRRVLLLKPQTFMNRSGDSVASAVKFYKLELSAVTVIYDELDLAPGKVRVKTGGGNGGHNGLRSIDPQIGVGYRRVRLGIGHPGHKELVNRHVLGDFAKADADWLDPLLEALADNIGLLLEGNESGFMNKLALAGGEESPAKPARPAQSHVRAARPRPAQVEPPQSGPMAAMLKKLLGDKSG
ncbi:aminoacyl-tRNA hydrolase [Arsenicitalea aurantiaca]|uniref:Peptidyl-tRNA hydrolase n=1 Tax=Arsenicitalea aurantiaca TaxID=1783274 RepID=A0A433XLK0_9HYPH|nr:aminoacyl-tRNA hydrolase [Arsenicitalea aurantiaca]RUT34962.1 aminoacyl-tRNA hydrolase [Arsenicitalea aurantiaca]